MVCGLELATSSGESTKVTVEPSIEVSQVSISWFDGATSTGLHLRENEISTLAAKEGWNHSGKKTKTAIGRSSMGVACMGECHSFVCLASLKAQLAADHCSRVPLEMQPWQGG